MRLITVKKAHLESDLTVLKSKLEAEGIRCFLKNEYVTQIVNFMPSFEMELQVSADDVIKTLKIIEDLKSDEE